MTQARSAHLLQHRVAGAGNLPDATSHVAMIKRFAKFALSIVLISVVVTAVMAIKVVAWFPPFPH